MLSKLRGKKIMRNWTYRSYWRRYWKDSKDLIRLLLVEVQFSHQNSLKFCLSKRNAPKIHCIVERAGNMGVKSYICISLLLDIGKKHLLLWFWYQYWIFCQLPLKYDQIQCSRMVRMHRNRKVYQYVEYLVEKILDHVASYPKRLWEKIKRQDVNFDWIHQITIHLQPVSISFGSCSWYDIIWTDINSWVVNIWYWIGRIV